MASNAVGNSCRVSATKSANALIGHPQAGQRSAVIYSVLGSRRRHRINPAEYLRDAFERLPYAKTSERKSQTHGGLGKSIQKAATSAHIVDVVA